VFDREGKTLYFTASTDVGLQLAVGPFEFSASVTRNVYAVVLKKGDANPVERKAMRRKVGKEEKGKRGDKDKEEDKDKDKGKDSGPKTVKKKRARKARRRKKFPRSPLILRHHAARCSASDSRSELRATGRRKIRSVVSFRNRGRAAVWRADAADSCQV